MDFSLYDNEISNDILRKIRTRNNGWKITKDYLENYLDEIYRNGKETEYINNYHAFNAEIDIVLQHLEEMGVIKIDSIYIYRKSAWKSNFILAMGFRKFVSIYAISSTIYKLIIRYSKITPFIIIILYILIWLLCKLGVVSESNLLKELLRDLL